jgi:hypothetical protein
VLFYPYPELEIKKYAEGQELLIFAVFWKTGPLWSGVRMSRILRDERKSAENTRNNSKISNERIEIIKITLKLTAQ